MANTIPSFNIIGTKTLISSSVANANNQYLKDFAPIWQKYTVTYTNLSAATPSADYLLFAASTSDIISGVYIKHSAAFTGGAVSAAKISIGTSGDYEKYCQDHDAFAAAGATAFTLNQVLNKESAATDIILHISLTGGNLNALGAGVVDVYIQKNTLP